MANYKNIREVEMMFCIIGFSKSEIASGKGLKLADIMTKLITDVDIVRAEYGKILSYSLSGIKVSNDFKQKYGEYFEYNFIKKSIIPKIEKEMELRIIGEIEENEIPKESSIDFKL